MPSSAISDTGTSSYNHRTHPIYSSDFLLSLEEMQTLLNDRLDHLSQTIERLRRQTGERGSRRLDADSQRPSSPNSSYMSHRQRNAFHSDPPVTREREVAAQTDVGSRDPGTDIVRDNESVIQRISTPGIAPEVIILSASIPRRTRATGLPPTNLKAVARNPKPIIVCSRLGQVEPSLPTTPELTQLASSFVTKI